MSRRGKRAVWPFVAVVVLCGGPFLAAIVLYLSADDWRPFGASNRGELIVPIRPLDTNGLEPRDGAPLDERFFAARWSLVYVDRPPCSNRCADRLDGVRQARLALGKDMPRLQVAFVVPDGERVAGAATLIATHPGLRVLAASPAWMARLAPGGAERLYLVDPQGNAMMVYERSQPASDILKDLKRLLRISRVG